MDSFITFLIFSTTIFTAVMLAVFVYIIVAARFLWSSKYDLPKNDSSED